MVLFCQMDVTGRTESDPAANVLTLRILGHVFASKPAPTRKAILDSAQAQWIRPPTEFAVSDMMVQMLTRDAHLQLAVNRYVDRLSKEIQTQDRSEQNFTRFVTYLNAVTARQNGSVKAPVTAHKKPAKAKRAPAPKAPAGR